MAAPSQPMPPRVVLAALVVWFFVLVWGIWQARTWAAQQSWKATTARVQSVRWKDGPHDHHSHNCPGSGDSGPRVVLLTYAYDVGGKTYTSKTYNHRFESELFCEEAPAKARAAALKRDGKLEVWFDPSDPGRAVQRKQSGGEAIFIVALLGIVGGVLTWAWRRQTKLQVAYEAALAAHLDAD